MSCFAAYKRWELRGINVKVLIGEAKCNSVIFCAMGYINEDKSNSIILLRYSDTLNSLLEVTKLSKNAYSP